MIASKFNRTVQSARWCDVCTQQGQYAARATVRHAQHTVTLTKKDGAHWYTMDVCNQHVSYAQSLPLTDMTLDPVSQTAPIAGATAQEMTAERFAELATEMGIQGSDLSRVRDEDTENARMNASYVIATA